MGRSYLRPTDVAQISQARRDMLMTRVAMQNPAVVLVLHRLDSNGYDGALAPQTDVVIRLADAPGAEQNEGGAAGSRLAGYIEKLEPFDVREGDTGVLANGWTFTVASVSAVQDGIVRADITVQTGYGLR